MPTAYKNPRGESEVRQWCSQALAWADFPLTAATVNTSVGQVRLTSAGTGLPAIVMVPGTGFNAAATLPWLRALSPAGRQPCWIYSVNPDSATHANRAEPGRLVRPGTG